MYGVQAGIPISWFRRVGVAPRIRLGTRRTTACSDRCSSSPSCGAWRGGATTAQTAHPRTYSSGSPSACWSALSERGCSPADLLCVRRHGRSAVRRGLKGSIG